MPTLDQLISYYKYVYGNSKNTSDVISNIRRINTLAGNDVLLSWINKEIECKNASVAKVVSEFDSFFNSHPGIKLPNRNNYKSALKKFSETILGFFSANIWMGHDIVLCQLIADNAIFASKEVVKQVRNGKLGTKENINNKGNRFASWDYMYHIRDTKKKGEDIPDTSVLDEYKSASPTVKADNNTCANIYMKHAVAESFNRQFGGLPQSKWNLFKGYEVCHIWGDPYPKDRRYFASIANIVLLPRSLASLSDHNQDIIDLLRYEAWRRFHFVPDGEHRPKRPIFYPQIKWRFPKNW